MVYKTVLSTGVHPTAEWVYEQVKQELRCISIGTVYRVLGTLAEAGLVKKVDTPHGQARYEGKKTEHHHIYIKNTDEIKAFESEELSRKLKQRD